MSPSVAPGMGCAVDVARAIGGARRTIVFQENRAVEIDDRAILAEQECRRHRERAAEHIADHDVAPQCARPFRKAQAVGETAAFVEFDIDRLRSEEHTSELQSLMRIPYAVFRLKKKNIIKKT